MTTTPEAAKIPADVMQAAREAAAYIWGKDGGEWLSSEFRSGMRDNSASVQVAIAAIHAERERCAGIAENYSGLAHAAFDMGSKSFPNKSPVPDFIAKQIRGEG